MDPNANLKEQEQLLSRYRNTGITWKAGDLARFQELQSALRGWLRGGGFEPDWTLGPIAAFYYDRGK